MRVLYFHQHFCALEGAGGTRSYEFARALIKRGHFVTVVCGQVENGGLRLPFDRRRRWFRGELEGIDVISLPIPYSNNFGTLKRVVCFVAYAWRALGLVVTESCDLVFATSTPISVFVPGTFARWVRSVPFVLEVRDLWPSAPRALGMRNPILLAGMSVVEWIAYRSCRAAIGLSPGIVNGIKRKARSGLEVTLIPNGCDLSLFDPNGKERDRSREPREGAFTAIYAGAHGFANGLEAVLDAADVLRRRGEAGIQFTFIGDGKAKLALVERAQKLGLSNCQFLPPMSKRALAKHMPTLGCGLMVLRNIPEFYDGTSPNKYFDYLASGLPVVTNYPGWLAKMIEEEGCGVAVSPGDAEAFADALEQLAKRFHRTRQMGMAARRLAERRFSRERLATKFCQVLEDVAPSSAGRSLDISASS